MKEERVEGSLLVTGSIALEALSVLFLKEEEKIRASFPSFFVEQTARTIRRQQEEQEQSGRIVRQALKTPAVRNDYGIRLVQPLSEGGIFNALWNACERLETGCEIELERIPILQETVEICELFDVNPYYALSGGSMMIAVNRGNELYWYLKNRGVTSAIIGVLKPGRKRTILSGPDFAHVRCLDRPQRDSLTGRPDSKSPCRSPHHVMK